MKIKNKKMARHSQYLRELRVKATVSELKFKAKLEEAGYRFMFQKGFVAGYHCIVDFYLPKPYKLCVEVDGGYHDNPEQIAKDQIKDRYLRSRGLRIARIKNEDIDGVDVVKFVEDAKKVKIPSEWWKNKFKV